MVLRYMKRVIKIFLLVTIAICFSCEDMGWFANCSDCTSTEPEMANLEIKLKESVGPISVRIFEGELEDSVLYDYAQVSGPIFAPLVSLNKRYTITATYTIEGITYTAIDSATPRVKFTEEQCEEACYYVYDKVIDLRLKYTAR